MTQDQMTYDQMIAAWIGAGAAVAQAIGAITAIWVSIRLARDSAKREIEANQAADRRIEEANRASDARHERERIAENNRPVDRVIGLLQLVIEESKAHKREEEKRYENSRAIIVGGLEGPQFRYFFNSIKEIKDNISSPILLKILTELQKNIRINNNEGFKFINYIDYLDNQIKIMDNSLAAIKNSKI